MKRLETARGSRPEVVVYSCAAFSGILSRSPDLVPILEEAGYAVTVIPNPYSDMVTHGAKVNVHPKYGDNFEVLVL